MSVHKLTVGTLYLGLRGDNYNKSTISKDCQQTTSFV